jgi:hypothetical protein
VRTLKQISAIRRKRIHDFDSEHNFIPGTNIRRAVMIGDKLCYTFTIRIATPDLDEEERQIYESGYL